jgi:MFS family permease
MVSPTPEFHYAVLPELAECLFAGALLLGNEVTAQWMSFLALAVTAAAVAGFVRRVSGDQAGLWGAGLVLSNSALLLLGGLAYGDMILTAFVTVAILSFERWKGEGGERWLTVSGFMAGFAAGTKYSALFFPPILVLMIAASTGWRRGVRPVLMFLVPCAAAALPWYVFNMYHTGNPVWPFFSAVFGARYWNGTDIAAQTSDLLTQYGSGKSLQALLTLPWNLFAHVELFHSDGALSYLLIAGFPFALYAVARERSARRLALLAGGYAIFWFFTAQILRYLIPVIPLYCAIAAAGAGVFVRQHMSRRFLPVGGALLAIVLFLPAAFFALRFAGAAGFPPSTPGERDRFLEKRLPSYGAVRFLNARAGNAYTLYSYHDPQMAYFANGAFRGDFFGPWRYSRIEGALEAGEDTLLATLHDHGRRLPARQGRQLGVRLQGRVAHAQVRGPVLPLPRSCAFPRVIRSACSLVRPGPRLPGRHSREQELRACGDTDRRHGGEDVPPHVHGIGTSGLRERRAAGDMARRTGRAHTDGRGFRSLSGKNDGPQADFHVTRTRLGGIRGPRSSRGKGARDHPGLRPRSPVRPRTFLIFRSDFPVGFSL